jgi:hypothetical protein
MIEQKNYVYASIVLITALFMWGYWITPKQLPIRTVDFRPSYTAPKTQSYLGATKYKTAAKPVARMPMKTFNLNRAPAAKVQFRLVTPPLAVRAHHPALARSPLKASTRAPAQAELQMRGRQVQGAEMKLIPRVLPKKTVKTITQKPYGRRYASIKDQNR